MKGMYAYVGEFWKNQDSDEFRKLRWMRLIGWRKDNVVHRIERPTRIDRARSLGYKAKQGFVVVRVRVRRGSMRNSRPNKGRTPSKMGVLKITTKKSLKRIAEERAGLRYPNLEVLNSYFVAKDGRHKFFEVILVDPVIVHLDAVKRKGRVYRGLTSEGKKNRGMRKNGKGAVHNRPSVNRGMLRGK